MTNEDDDEVINLCITIFSLETPFYDWLHAWDQLRPWFAKKGYSLYILERHHMYYWYPQHYVKTEPDLFFAEMGGDPDLFEPHKMHPLQTPFSYRVGFAQDASFRHLCLKLIKRGSEEHKILTFLHNNKEEAMVNCVMPILDFLNIGDYSFAIMPRWGSSPESPWFATVREAAKFIQDILKAYSYLHKNFIVYQDIKLPNILMNHFSGDYGYVGDNEIREILRRHNKARYVLCDFDSSFLLSPSPPGKPIRLSGEISFDIFQEKPHDTRQGEPDYDPFAFDIGCLGIVFWNTFSTNVRSFPLIVPLVDKMITGKLDERFSAAEALQFVGTHILGGSADLLDRPLASPDNALLFPWDPDDYDKWADLPIEFVAKWRMHKAPRSSRRDRVLRKICTKVYKGYEVIKFFRSQHKYFKRLYKSIF